MDSGGSGFWVSLAQLSFTNVEHRGFNDDYNSLTYCCLAAAVSQYKMDVHNSWSSIKTTETQCF